MRRLLTPSIVVTSLVLGACTASRASQGKMRWEDAWASQETPRVEPEQLISMFVSRSKTLRASATQGSRMPAEQVSNWRTVLEHVRSGVGGEGREPALPVAKRRELRRTLERELESDTRVYGEIPGALADDIQLALTRLAPRKAPVARVRRAPRYSWPIEPVNVTSEFGWRMHPLRKVYRPHQGVDLAASLGQLVTASAAGIVTFAGWNGAHGRHVEIRHPGGVVTRYSHLSQLLVVPGAVVEARDPVGLAGATGYATGVHVHFELIREGQHVDPLEVLGAPEELDPFAQR